MVIDNLKKIVWVKRIVVRNKIYIWVSIVFLALIAIFICFSSLNKDNTTIDIVKKYDHFNTKIHLDALTEPERKKIADEYISLARQMSQNDKYEKAIESLNTSIKAFPKHPYVHNELADLYLSKAFFDNSNDIDDVKKSKEFNQAIIYAKKNISLHPTYFKSYDVLINIYSSVKDYDYASKIALNACLKTPENKFICKRAADLYLLQGKKMEAIDFYKDLAKKTSDNQSSWIYKRIAAIYRAEGNCKSSIYYYKKAYKLNSSPAILEELMQSCTAKENTRN